jgi:mono/diheme cytochrome c family protein
MLCSRCHGVNGKGEAATPLEGKPTNFTALEWQKRVSDQHIKNVIIKGGAALGLSRDMPAWQGAFNDAEIELMVKKIRSFGKSESAQR